MTGWDVFSGRASVPAGMLAELAALRAALPGYDVILTSHSPARRYEAIRRTNGPGPWCVISSNPADLWRELAGRAPPAAPDSDFLLSRRPAFPHVRVRRPGPPPSEARAPAFSLCLGRNSSMPAAPPHAPVPPPTSTRRILATLTAALTLPPGWPSWLPAAPGQPPPAPPPWPAPRPMYRWPWCRSPTPPRSCSLSSAATSPAPACTSPTP